MKHKFYYAGEEQIVLSPVENLLAVKFKPDVDEAACSAIADRLQSSSGTLASELLPSFNLSLVSIDPQVSSESLSQEIEDLSTDSAVDSVLTVFQMPEGEDGEVLILDQQFRVQFTPDAKAGQISKLNKEHSVQVVAKEDLGSGSYLLAVTDESKLNALELANLYHENDLTEYAEPDWIMVMNKLAAAVNDPFLSQQWALSKMRVKQAWELSRGSNRIKIAILDEGVQTSHPDLRGKIVDPYDAITNTNNQEPNAWDGHGTACAGIAAAITNNRQGIAGVAPNCMILPVRIAQGRQNAPGWITNTTIIARGIYMAVNRGADVLSNSWGGGAYNATIRRAFQYAITHGRAGKGCVVISAAGNSDVRRISYPAKYPESLACGASNQWDQRKSRTSRDGETWWGSQYGPELDFLAPGVKIYTTDIRGGGGYGSGDYVPNFNGTSSATPNAAGVAALILSIDPHLKHWEVADILKLSARDLGPRGRDDQHGWGRIDALKAVQ
ncbi:MAG: S8 family serine peptidase, partial [Pseudomonadota bacterium]